jgi:hypothetical protein
MDICFRNSVKGLLNEYFVVGCEFCRFYISR